MRSNGKLVRDCFSLFFSNSLVSEAQVAEYDNHRNEEPMVGSTHLIWLIIFIEFEFCIQHILGFISFLEFIFDGDGFSFPSKLRIIFAVAITVISVGISDEFS